MRSSQPTSLPQLLAATFDDDRDRDLERLHARHRALLDGPAAGPSLAARFAATIVNLVRRDHSLTDYPCRLANGSMGRVAVVRDDGDWTLVCRVA